MRKSTIYILIALVAVLVAGIAVAVKSLYSGSDKNKTAVDTGQFIERHELIEAVPSVTFNTTFPTKPSHTTISQ